MLIASPAILVDKKFTMKETENAPHKKSSKRIQKTPGAPGTNLSKSDLEEPDNINKYRSLVGKLMWFTTKVVPDVANQARELTLHMSHPGLEHWKTLGRFIGCLKVNRSK